MLFESIEWFWLDEIQEFRFRICLHCERRWTLVSILDLYQHSSFKLESTQLTIVSFKATGIISFPCLFLPLMFPKELCRKSYAMSGIYWITLTFLLHYRMCGPVVTDYYQLNPTSLTAKETSSVVVMTRASSGERWRVGASLLHQLRMFFDWTSFSFTFVLDDDSFDDRVWGRCLKDAIPQAQVKYETLPQKPENLFSGKDDRQRWSTFHLDLMADPSDEVIGVIHGDPWCFSYLSRGNIFAWNDHITLRAAKGQSCDNIDSVALGMKTPYNFMYVDKAPIFWFWKSTFVNVRNHIASHWNSSFEDVFRNLSMSTYSPLNIIANYASRWESYRYLVVMHEDDENSCCYQCETKDVLVSCCVVFNVSCPPGGTSIQDRSRHVNRYNNYKSVWETAVANPHYVDRQYANVRKDMLILEVKNISLLNSMKDACTDFVAANAIIQQQPLCSILPWPTAAKYASGTGDQITG